MVHLILPQQSRCSLEMHNYDLTSRFLQATLAPLLNIWSVSSSLALVSGLILMKVWLCGRNRILKALYHSQGCVSWQTQASVITQSCHTRTSIYPGQLWEKLHHSQTHNPTHSTALSLKGQRSRAAHLMISHNSTSTSRALFYKQGANRCSFLFWMKYKQKSSAVEK